MEPFDGWWSDDPRCRLTTARTSPLATETLAQLTADAPMKPWPYGMPTSANPFLLFLGPSPGADDDSVACAERNPYAPPTVGVPHPGVYFPTLHYTKIRELAEIIIHAQAPGLRNDDAHALIGHLNLGTGAFGSAKNAQVEPAYGEWVPDIILDRLRPRYVLMLGMKDIILKPLTAGRGFDPRGRLNVNWNRPDLDLPFRSYTQKSFRFRIWTRNRSAGYAIHFVAWPNHPKRAPMTSAEVWRASGTEFAEYAHSMLQAT
jgi:hypothetical protein